MQQIVLLAPNIQPEMQAALAGRYRVFDLTGHAKPKDVPGLDPANVRAVVTKGESVFGANLIDALPKLEIIANFGVGYDGIDVRTALKRGVVVTHTPDVNTDEAANTALALALAITRRICELDRFVRSGEWVKGDFPLTASLVGKTCGILGLGKIGSGIARRVEACGGRVAYHSRTRKEVAYEYFPDALSLATASSLLFVSCPGGEATRGLVDAKVLAALGSEGFLINAARGPIVDEAALIGALGAGTIAGAGLDVFENEPNVPEALRRMPNVVLTPHVGSATRETRQRMADTVLANLEKHFVGEPVVTPVPEMRA
jgi:hydroxypyruvate reductase